MLRRKAARQINKVTDSSKRRDGFGDNSSTSTALPLHHHQKDKKHSPLVTGPPSSNNPLGSQSNSNSKSNSKSNSNANSNANSNPGGKVRLISLCLLVPFFIYIFIGYKTISLNLDSFFSTSSESTSTSTSASLSANDDYNLTDNEVDDDDQSNYNLIEEVGLSKDSTSSSIISTGNTSKNMKDIIEEEMKQKLRVLSSPEWPQLDHRTAEAMASGVLLGVSDITEFNFNHTIVTAYYEFTSKHSVREYTKWMKGLFQTSDPIIIFLEPKSKWYDIVQELRQHAPTLVVPLKFDDLVMSTTFTKQFWDYEHSIDTEAKIHKSANVYKIWNEKLIFIQNAIHLNPFRTNGFAWMDTGYFRAMRDAPEPGTPIVKLDYNAAGVPKEKVLVMHVRNDPLEAVARVNVAGNCFFGTAEAFLQFYTNYYTTFWDWISVKNKFIGSDQFVMTETCRRYAAGCYPYFAGRFKTWFALAAVIMKRKTMSRISPHYLFLENPPASLPKLPHGNKVSYCKGSVVVANDLKCK